MSAMQRTKGAAGERELARELADIGGWTVRRRVRNDHGDSDLVGVPGWSIECKRHRSATASDVRAWWDQAVRQASGEWPVLMYRLDFARWRAVWPVSVLMMKQKHEMWCAYEWTAETSLEAWAAVAREINTGLSGAGTASA